MRSANTQLLEAELMGGSPEYVFAWLKNRAEGAKDQWRGGDDELEDALLTRNSPLIDLGLAQYGFSAKVVRRLFDVSLRVPRREIPVLGSSEQTVVQAPKFLRLAALSNRVVQNWAVEKFPYTLFGEGRLERIRAFLTSADADEIRALFQNPTIDGGFLASLYAKNGPFEGLDDEEWRQLIVASIGSPRLRTEYNGPMDGWAEYSHRRVFDEAWTLAERVSITKDWANVLASLLENTTPEAFSIKDRMAVIKRWRADASSEQGSQDLERRNGGSDRYGCLEEFETMRHVLTRLMTVEEINALRTNEDIAMRCAFYRFGQIDPTAMKEAYEREAGFFLSNALWNDAIWRGRETRGVLRELCWADKSFSDLHYPNFHRDRYATVSEEHPDWFREEHAAEEPASSLADLTTQVNTILALQTELQNRVVGLHRRLTAVLWIVAVLLAVLLLRRL